MKLKLPGYLRPQSCYIGGNPGSGKSSLIQRLALEDIRKGRGVCVIDPTGDLVNRLIHWIPKERVADTIYFDTDDPFPIDFFSYRNPAERQVLADQLLDIFNLENAPISRPRLQRIIGTLFDANENPAIPDRDRCTFLDIQHFIENKNRQKTIVSYCPHREAQLTELPKISDLVSILERMTPFTESHTLKTMLGAKRPKLNIWDVMQNKKVFLVNLKDTPTDLFIGSLIASKFQQAAFGRRYIPESQRTPYYLYIDECNTILEYGRKYFEKILLRARKYKLCLTLANQIPEDLPQEIQRKLGTFGTLVLFNLDTNNARVFKDRIVPFEVEHLVNLRAFRAICRVGTRVYRVGTPSFLGPSPASYAKIIKKRTIDEYGYQAAQSVASLKEDEITPTGRPKDIPLHRGEA
jgi:hypothetical protein